MEDQCIYYLSKYELLVNTNTIPFSGYLSTAAHIYWGMEKYERALDLSNKYDLLENDQMQVWDFSGMQTTKALILRDQGQEETALTLFNAENDSASKLGNIARCYQKMGDFQSCLEYLKRSLDMLLNDDGHSVMINLGYAYY